MLAVRRARIARQLAERWAADPCDPCAELLEEIADCNRIAGNLADNAALRELICTMHLEGFTHHGETKLTTEQKELLYDVLDYEYEASDPGSFQPRQRWWKD